MAANGASFVEWKEEYVSQERGSRIVHYILKDSSGKSILAVVGTERSLRHMVYVVAEEFLSYSGTDNPVQAGFKWRSRREVVDWLTSMLAKQQQSDTPGDDTTESLGSSELLSSQVFSFAHKMDHRVRNLRQSYSDVVWLGAAWTCGKQLKHYPAFCRNGTTIAVQSFVFVMAKEENRYVAYLEGMYEDRKGQKKVKVRWFHHSQEVKGVVRLKNAHPKEVYITPHTQVISVECVDGPAIVLTREHFEKCMGIFQEHLPGKIHLCFRQFRNSKIKPFDLSKMRGYFDQPIISCLESNTFPNSGSLCDLAGVKLKAFRSGENVGRGTKRTRSSGDLESFLTGHIRKKTMSAPICKTGNNKRLISFKNMVFKVDDKVEVLCQDSGIRGCWFRCTVLEISRKQMKVQYNDVVDEDACGNLEEWVPAFRLAAADKLGMRCLGRPTIRPCPPTINGLAETEFQVGAPADAWWGDGWWEGVLTAANNGGGDDLQVYVPGENMFLNVRRKDVRVSRDWVDGKWVDVKAKLDILSVIGPETKSHVASTLQEDDKADNVAPQAKVDGNENTGTELLTPATSAGPLDRISSQDKKDHDDGDCDNNRSDADADDDQNVKREGKSGAGHAENTETATQNDEALELEDVVT